MKRLLTFALVALYFSSAVPAHADCDSSGVDASNQAVAPLGTHILYTGNCADDNDVLISTGDISSYDACSLMSTAGVVDVLVSLDGTTFSTAPLSLIDAGATDTNPVLVTVALRVYEIPIAFSKIKILQNGATDATAHLWCKKYG